MSGKIKKKTSTSTKINLATTTTADNKLISNLNKEFINNVVEENSSFDDILFIENVCLNKLNEFNVELINKIDENSVDENLEYLKFSKENILQNDNNNTDRIKDKFISIDEWYNNNILCWYCTCSFNNKSVFIPKKINPHYIDVEGNFCTFNCCFKYINIYYKIDDKIRNNYINNLKYLYKLFHDKDIKLIRESPDKELLKKFGGFMSEQEYKEAIKKLKNIYY